MAIEYSARMRFALMQQVPSSHPFLTSFLFSHSEASEPNFPEYVLHAHGFATHDGGSPHGVKRGQESLIGAINQMVCPPGRRNGRMHSGFRCLNLGKYASYFPLGSLFSLV